MDKKRKKFIDDGNPTRWMEYADDFYCASKIMLENSGDRLDLDGQYNVTRRALSLSRIIILNCGFCLEVIIKAYLIAKNPIYVNNGKLDKKLKNHDLIDLLQLCPEVKLNKAEKELMVKFSEAIPYWGRYPVPLEQNKISTEEVVTREAFDTFEKIYKKIESKVYKLIKGGWTGGADTGFKAFRTTENKNEIKKLIKTYNSK